MKTDKNWQECLTPEQYRIMREKGTERAFTGQYYNHHATGSYVCAACGQELFSSNTKFDSGTGWPSFTKPATPQGIKEQTDKSLGMSRTEVLCAKCESHLGHVFDDGPTPSGRRYCINSVALNFKEKALHTAASSPAQTITFGAGCFWCTEAAFESIDGVLSAESGYMGGSTKDPTYEEVCTGRTGHAEVTRVTYDPARVTLERLLDVFWMVHDPTTLNRQGADVGTQYRSAIFYSTEDQKSAAEKSLNEQGKKLDRKIVTEITEAGDFFKAEDYHQDYFRNNANVPYCRNVIAPKLKKLKADK